MPSYLFEWLSLLGRWLHIIVAMAWIGASFYFVWLDNHLLAPTDPQLKEKGVSGELWAVHGGGFYNAQKYLLTPDTIPSPLHWFKWEAYWTWLSGFFLLCVVYYSSPTLYLMDPSVANISPVQAVLIGLGSLGLGTFLYDRLCASPIGNDSRRLTLVITLLLIAAAYGYCHVYSGRGAFIHMGALMGTIMVANVFFVIIPGQRELILAKMEQRPSDPRHALRGKQRSVHNTYFTLPVVFIMISHHYAMTYAHPYNWLILIGLCFAGALIRISFVARHKGPLAKLPLIVAALLLAAVAYVLAPPTPTTTASSNKALNRVSFTQVQSIITNRCTPCHSANPTQPGFSVAPKNIQFNRAEQILSMAQPIYEQTSKRIMPLGNLTGITEEERQLIAQWATELEKK